jgi:hypothetical protein
MPKSSKEKLEFTISLIEKNLKYREIQEKVKEKYGTSISNSTIKKLQRELKLDCSKDQEIARLRKELEIFKNLYFELLEKFENKTTNVN